MRKLWNSEPALVVAFVQTFLAALLAFGLNLSAAQVAAIVAVVSAAGGLITRSQVTPVATLPPEPAPP